MITRLAKKIGALAEIRDTDPGFSDLAALLTGIKPVLYTDFDVADWPYLKDLCLKLKLEYLLPEALFGRKGFKAAPKYGKKMLLIGRKRKDLEAAAASWGRAETTREWGLLLGYPPCCVDAYLDWKENYSERTDLIRWTYGRTPAAKSYPFGLNNVCNFFSRLTPGDAAKYRKVGDINYQKGFPLANLHVISWHPCSYACKKSAAAAAEIFSFFKVYLPEHAAMLRAVLARPVLVYGKYEFLSFEGKVVTDELRFSGVGAPYSLMNSPLRPGALKLSAVARLGAGRPAGQEPFLLNFSPK